MSGGTTSIEEMIATTKRGLVVTRFDNVQQLDFTSQLYRGYTRDGLWLVENGKITKPVKNMVFTESTLFALNAVEQLGVPRRVFARGGDATLGGWMFNMIVPPLKIRDFSFTALTDAI
jgi:predicted Zn-dependent protease